MISSLSWSSASKNSSNFIIFSNLLWSPGLKNSPLGEKAMANDSLDARARLCKKECRWTGERRPKQGKLFLSHCHICWCSRFRTLMTCKIPFCLAEPNLIVIQLNSNIRCYVSANRRKLLFMAHQRSLGLCLERPKLSQRNISACFIKDQPVLKNFQVPNCNLAIPFKIL